MSQTVLWRIIVCGLSPLSSSHAVMVMTWNCFGRPRFITRSFLPINHIDAKAKRVPAAKPSIPTPSTVATTTHTGTQKPTDTIPANLSSESVIPMKMIGSSLSRSGMNAISGSITAPTPYRMTAACVSKKMMKTSSSTPTPACIPTWPMVERPSGTSE